MPPNPPIRRQSHTLIRGIFVKSIPFPCLHKPNPAVALNFSNKIQKPKKSQKQKIIKKRKRETFRICCPASSPITCPFFHIEAPLKILYLQLGPWPGRPATGRSTSPEKALSLLFLLLLLLHRRRHGVLAVPHEDVDAHAVEHQLLPP